MDSDLAKVLENDLLKYGDWEQRLATPTLADQIPDLTGLYMFVFRSHLKFRMANGQFLKNIWILYVGRAGNTISNNTLRSRYKNEYAKYVGGDPDILWQETPDKNRVDMLKKYLCIWPIEYWYLTIEDRSNIPLLEDRLIKLFSPPLNKSGRLRVRASEPHPAFRESK